MFKQKVRVIKLKNSFIWALALFAFITVSGCVWIFGNRDASRLESFSRPTAEILKFMPITIYDVRFAAWRTVLNKDGTLSLTFNQGPQVEGWGSWNIERDQLIVTRKMQERFEPETGEPVHSDPIIQKTIYEVSYDKNRQLLLDNTAKGSDGMWSVGNF